MKVKELIEKLKKANQEQDVYVEVDDTGWIEKVDAVFENDLQYCVVLSPNDWDKNVMGKGIVKL